MNLLVESVLVSSIVNNFCGGFRRVWTGIINLTNSEFRFWT